MELLLYAAAFYAWQCLVRLPPAGSAWFPWPFGWLRVRGPGTRMLSPWPGARTWISGGFAFELTPSAVFTEVPAGWGPEERRVSLEDAEAIELRGARLFAGGAELLATALDAEARWLAAAFVRLGRTPPAERPAAIEALVAHSLSAAACRDAWREARRATRWLRLACDAEFVLAFVVAGALASPLGGDAAWRSILPAIGATHLAALAGLWLAERRLATPADERATRFFVGALFPPALLRAPCDLVNAHLAGFHPATLAGVSLPRRRAGRLLHTAIGAAERPAWDRHGGRPCAELEARRRYADLVLSGLLRLAADLEVDPDTLRSREPADGYSGPTHCPICLDEFRPGFVACADCGVATVLFERI